MCACGVPALQTSGRMLTPGDADSGGGGGSAGTACRVARLDQHSLSTCCVPGPGRHGDRMNQMLSSDQRGERKGMDRS